MHLHVILARGRCSIKRKKERNDLRNRLSESVHYRKKCYHLNSWIFARNFLTCLSDLMRLTSILPSPEEASLPPSTLIVLFRFFFSSLTSCIFATELLRVTSHVEGARCADRTAPHQDISAPRRSIWLAVVIQILRLSESGIRILYWWNAETTISHSPGVSERASERASGVSEWVSEWMSEWVSRYVLKVLLFSHYTILQSRVTYVGDRMKDVMVRVFKSLVTDGD